MAGLFDVYVKHDDDRCDRREELISMFDEAWEAVVQDDQEARRLEAAHRKALEEHRDYNLKVQLEGTAGASGYASKTFARILLSAIVH